MKLPNLYYPPNTLGWYLNAPVFNPVNIGTQQTKAFVSCMKKFVDNDGSGKHPMTHGTPKPEVGALTFYGMNHGMAEIMSRYAREEKLPEDVNDFVSRYTRFCIWESVRAYYYLFLIVTREFRHAHHSSSKLKTWEGMPAFFDIVNGAGSVGAVNRLMSHAPETPVGQYLEAIEWSFTNMGFGGGFGGKPWADITTCAKRFAIGETSAEVMLDTIWTLSHNNGPIFNKGMLYAMYGNSIKKILDVQRSGQIPQYVLTEAQQYSNPKLNKDMQWVISTFGLTSKVDYELVEALGALGTYTNKKKPKPKPAQPTVFPFFSGKGTVDGTIKITANDTVSKVKYERAKA